jgi:hypothetical protein
MCPVKIAGTNVDAHDVIELAQLLRRSGAYLTADKIEDALVTG